ncbi:MAG: hypothetical protein ACTSVZ_01545 [Promethearchaeota archaeon]
MPRSSRGGGSRSRGGGTRKSGGSRSSGRSSRSSAYRRSSGRYNRYHKPYYRYRSYHYRTSNPICICCFFFVFVGFMLAIGGILLFVPLSPKEGLILIPNETYLIEVSERAESISVDLTSGQIETYFFENAPSLTDSQQYTMEIELFLYGGDYGYQEFYLKPSSELVIDWESERLITWYIIKGSSNFADFDEGYSFYSMHEEDSTSVTNFVLESIDEDFYYLVWEAYSLSQNVDAYIEVDLAEYDVSGADSTKINSFEEGNVPKFLVIKNMDNVYDAVCEYQSTNPAILIYDSLYPILIGGFYVVFSILVIRALMKKRRRPISEDSGNFEVNSRNAYPTSELRSACSSCGKMLDLEILEEVRSGGEVFCKYCGNRL